MAMSIVHNDHYFDRNLACSYGCRIHNVMLITEYEIFMKYPKE